MKTDQSNKTALILVDPFNDFLSEGGKLWNNVKETVEGNNVVENLKKLVSECRKSKIQIVYAPHRKTEKEDYLNWNFLSPSHMGSLKLTLFEKGTWGGEFHSDLQPQKEDLIAQNHWTASGFANTDLDFILKQHGINRIIVAGMRANTCIDSTARYGVELGYHVTLIKDGIGAFNWEEIKATVETNFPNYGHSLLTTDEFLESLK
ncbi:cysteine hydrolase family protein [Flavobacterium sp. MC2016-06]|jgi:nicotinamidase-related amidase|uniref:cysteine hydrolase family protein n=1 Tax=Flavobacterium sp. MC2016-06 TaxID=2676308 RepID=UPI0012BAE88F|nr:cysteine hydrolase family protein [Flavobacterium sp. MC2016-06]MBU3858906.1 cysteine hydrolase family protein [Flavobacterium sp. MC2016-06]